jgi:hypothetical protein
LEQRSGLFPNRTLLRFRRTSSLCLIKTSPLSHRVLTCIPINTFIHISSAENGFGSLENNESSISFEEAIRASFEEDIRVSNFRAAFAKLKVLNNVSLLLFRETVRFFSTNETSKMRFSDATKQNAVL